MLNTVSIRFPANLLYLLWEFFTEGGACGVEVDAGQVGSKFGAGHGSRDRLVPFWKAIWITALHFLDDQFAHLGLLVSVFCAWAFVPACLLSL